MFGGFNKILNTMSLNDLKGVNVNRRLELLKPKPKSFMGVTLRVEKLNGKCILEKDNDLVLRNLVRLLYHLFANYVAYPDPSITVTDVTGASYTGSWGSSVSGTIWVKNASSWSSVGDIGQDDRGILIGSGTTPPTRTDYALVSKITHGTGVGQIYYNRQSYELLTDYSFRLTREFTNAGSDLSVSEAGLVYPTLISGTVRYLLLLRDTFTAVSVTTGNGIRVRYTFSF
jgi:hypothetical protein